MGTSKVDANKSRMRRKIMMRKRGSKERKKVGLRLSRSTIENRNR